MPAADEPMSGGQPLSHWLRFLADKRRHVRKHGLEGLSDIGPSATAAIEPLTRLLADSQDIRDLASDRLAQIGAAAVPTLLAALAVAAPEVRAAAARALGRIGTAARPALPLLRPLLADASPALRLRAAEALWRIDQQADPVIPVLVPLLRASAASDAAAVLAEIGQPALPALKLAAQDSSASWQVRSLIARINPDDPDIKQADDSSNDVQDPEAIGNRYFSGAWLAGLIGALLFVYRRDPLLAVLIAGGGFYSLIQQWTQAGLQAWRGLEVQKVVVGMGPTLFSVPLRGIQFSLRLIPILGETEYVYYTDRHDEASAARIAHGMELLAWTASLIVGTALIVASWLVGRVEVRYLSEPARVGWVSPISALGKAGLQRGDVIVAVNQEGQRQETTSWRDLVPALRSVTGPAELECRRGSETINLRVELERPAILDLQPELAPVIATISKNSAADRASLQVGDRIAAIDGTPTPHAMDVRLALFPHLLLIQDKDGEKREVRKEAKLTIDRGGKTLDVVLPSSDLRDGLLGVTWRVERSEPQRLGPLAAFQAACGEVGELVRWAVCSFFRLHEHGHARTESTFLGSYWLPLDPLSRYLAVIGLLGVGLFLFQIFYLPGHLGIALVEASGRPVPGYVRDYVDWGTLAVLGVLIALRLWVF